MFCAHRSIFVLLLVATFFLTGRGGAQEPDLPSFADTCFTPFDTAKSLIQDKDLRQWFDVIAGTPQGIYETKTRLGKCGAIEGIVRLNLPLTDDSVLRFALEDFNRLQIHLFRGDTGATLIYHEDDQFRWAGYVTTRKPRGVTPLSWTIAATDDHRNRRTSPKNHDHYELRCREGEAILSRGDVVLLRVPFSGPPEDVYFQGKAAFHGLALARTKDSPPEAPKPNAAREVSPAKQNWLQQLDVQSRVQILPSGAVRLATAEKPKKRSWIATPLPRDSVSEILLELSDVAPGAGIYLGNGKEGPRYVLRYALDRRSRHMCMWVRGDDDTDEHDFRGLTEFPLPSVLAHHWLRLVIGAGQLRWWVSPDGVHWAEPGEPIRNMPPDVTHLGLHCVSRQNATGLTLEKLSLRELPHLASVAPAELRGRAIAKPDAPSLGAWIADVTELTPAGIDTNEWRRACAWRTLAAGCNRGLGNELLLLLLNDDSTRALPLASQLPVLDDVALLIDVWDDQGFLQRFVKRYQETGQIAADRDEALGFSSIRHGLMTTPIASRHQLEIATDDLLRAEFIPLAYTGRWADLRRLTRELRFFQLQQKSPLFDWAESHAMRQRADHAPATLPLEKQKEEWRELLIEELNKDVYNLMAQWRVELSAANAENAGRQDAARLIGSLDQARQAGVAPHWNDGYLLVSLSTAVRSAVRRDASLQKALADEFREVAPLRVKQAIQNEDVDAVQLAADQFQGTEAGGAARLWLGDQALAAGMFHRAAAEFQLAHPDVPSAQRPLLAAKRRLVTSLISDFESGSPRRTEATGSPQVGALSLGSTQIAADEFEKWVKELAERSARQAGRRVVDVGPNSRTVPVPPPAAYQVQRRATLDGPVGSDPNREFARDVSRRQIDWVDRQLGIAVDANQMFVCNRFQVALYDTQSKQRVWQTAPPAGQIQFAQESTFTVSRPLLTGDRVFARLLYNPGATLACIDRSNGQFVWTSAPPQNEEIVSDPFWMRNELVCFKLIRTEQLESMLRLVVIDPVTGFTWREHDVLRLRDSWRRRRYCERVPIEDGVIVALGGIVANIDTKYRVRWIRQQVVLPADEETRWVHQYFQQPMVVDDCIYVSQPGVRTLECVRRDTGELVWSKLLLDLERVIGVSGGWLICQDSRGFMALDKQNGNEGWRYGAEGITVGVTCGLTGDLLFAQRIPVDPARSRFHLRLVWIDPASGRAKGTAPLAELTEADPRLGPLVVDQDRLWTFFGRGQNEATREVIELLPNGKAESIAQIESPDAWLQHTDAPLRDAAAKLFPQWKLLHAEGGDRAGLVAEAHGDRELLGLRFRNSGAIALGREISIPDKSKPRLRLRFGNEPSHPWKLDVRFRGVVVWSQDITPNTHPQPWKDFEVDLTPLAGQHGWLTIRASLPQGGDAPSYWKTLEMVF